MAIEDEGLDPEYEIEDKPKKKKKKIVDAESLPPVEITKAKLKKKLSINDGQKTLDGPVENVAGTQKTKKKKKKKELPVNNSEPLNDPPDNATSISKKTRKRKKKAEKEAQEGESSEKNAKKGNKTDLEKNSGSSKKKTDSQEDCQKFSAILEQVRDINMAYMVREFMSKLVQEGKIQAVDGQIIFQRWRKHRRGVANTKRIDEIVQKCDTLEEVKNVMNELVKKRLITPGKSKVIIQKWRTRENRRIKRQEEKIGVCYHCRQNGHVLADCPLINSGDVTMSASGICFKCGSGEHNIRNCPKKHVKGFAFATCFVCNQQGHLSRDCEKNLNGIYPDGGSCVVCGSQKHLKRDCPELTEQKKQKEEKRVVAHAMTAETRPDDDYDDTPEAPTEIQLQMKKTKVVNF